MFRQNQAPCDDLRHQSGVRRLRPVTPARCPSQTATPRRPGEAGQADAEGFPRRPEPAPAVDVRDQLRAGILRGMEPGVASVLIELLRSCEFRAGQTIFAQDDPGDRVFIIGSGMVKISRRGAGRHDNLLAVLGPSDIFGELALFDPAPRSCTATAVSTVEAVWLDRAGWRAWMDVGPGVAERLLQLLAQRLRHTEEELVELVSTDVTGRVARRLLLLARRFGRREGDTLRVAHELTQTELAQLVGADRASVNRALQDLASRRWIAPQRKSVLIIDPAALARRGKSSPIPGIRAGGAASARSSSALGTPRDTEHLGDVVRAGAPAAAR